MSESKLSPPRIVCAANRYTVHLGRCDGKVVIPSARHNDPMMHAIKNHMPMRLLNEEQGFIDQHGRFYTRLEAWPIAEANGQIRRNCGGDGPHRYGLFSENLY